MSSISPHSPNNFPEGEKFLKHFSQKLNSLPGDPAKVLKVLENILNKQSLEASESSLEALEILQMINSPPIETSKRVNTLAITTLRDEMIQCVHKKITDLKSQKLCREILTEIPSHRISSFIDRANRLYDEHLGEGMQPEQARIRALGKALLRSIIDLPAPKEMETNADLQEKIDQDTEIHDYICPIAHTLVGSDAVYLDYLPRVHYAELALRGWINARLKARLPCLAPIDNTTPISHENVKPDPKAAEFVENKLLPWIYPELIHKLEPKSSKSQEVTLLLPTTVLLALSAAHSSIKTQYEGVLPELNNPQKIEDLEDFSEKKIHRFILLAEGMDREIEEIASSYPSIIKDFLQDIETTMTDENLEAAREELLAKLRIFITPYREISSFQISTDSQKRVLKKAGEMTRKGSSLADIMTVVNRYLTSLQEEERIKDAFPRCLIGESEWLAHLGEVDDAPLPDGMFELLNLTYPLVPEKKIGETHSLILIPKTVNNTPLTLNSLIALLKLQGGFPNIEKDIHLDVLSEHGNTEAGPAHWVLIATDLIPQSNCVSYKEKETMLNNLGSRSRLRYEVPLLLPTAICLSLTYLISKETCLLPELYTACQEFTRGCPVCIGGFDSKGFIILTDIDYIRNQPFIQSKNPNCIGILPMIQLGS